jgi:hypothetical protein
MATKAFDCVEMKRECARRIYEQIKDMTREEELAYWHGAARRSERKRRVRRPSSRRRGSPALRSV